MATDMSVATEIARQIGSRAFMMMGTKGDKFGDKDALVFKVRGSKRVNKIRVRLDPSDTYTVTFWKLGPAPYFEVDVVEEMEGVYFDMLHDVISRVTGLTLRL